MSGKQDFVPFLIYVLNKPLNWNNEKMATDFLNCGKIVSWKRLDVSVQRNKAIRLSLFVAVAISGEVRSNKRINKL